MRRKLKSMVAAAVIVTMLSTPTLGIGQTPQPGGAGPCCEPNLEDYYHKKRAALELYQAAIKQVDEALDNFLHNVLEEMPEDLAKETLREAPLGAGKLTAMIALTKLRQWLINLINTGVAERLNLLLTSWLELQLTEALIELGEAVAIGATLGEILALTYDFGFYVHQANREMDDAKKTLAAANAMYDKALAALDKALRASAACEKEREQRMQPAKSFADRAHELRDSWENNGYLYQDPWGGPPLDAQAALERAKQILSGASSHGRLRLPVIRRAALITAAADGVRLTTQQLSGLVADTNRSKDTFARAMDRVIKWIEAANGVGQDLKGLQAELDQLDARTDAVSKALAANCKPVTTCGAPEPACGTGQVWCGNERRCVPGNYFDCNHCGCGQCR